MTETRAGDTATSEPAGGSTRRSKKPARRGNALQRFFGALFSVVPRSRLYLRQVVAEMRKVIWPTRRELLTYTAVVVVFVGAIITFVAGVDLGFAKLTLLIFG